MGNEQSKAQEDIKAVEKEDELEFDIDDAEQAVLVNEQDLREEPYKLHINIPTQFRIFRNRSFRRPHQFLGYEYERKIDPNTDPDYILHKYGTTKKDKNFILHSTDDVAKRIVQLTIDFDGHYYVGTGTIINIKNKKIYVLTTAHNLMLRDQLSQKICYADNVWFSISKKMVSSTKFYIYDKYTNGFDIANDLAIVECKIDFTFKLPKRFPMCCNMVHGSDMVIFGYPNDKNGELWGSWGMGVGGHDILRYDCSTSGGQSGSPVCSNSFIVGVCVETQGDIKVNRLLVNGFIRRHLILPKEMMMLIWSFYSDVAQVNSGVHFRHEKLEWIKKVSGANAREICFDGNGKVLMKDNMRNKISDLQIGDEVYSFPNRVSKIKCITVSNINCKTKMVELENNCWVTVEHPILINNTEEKDVSQYENISSLDSNILHEYGLSWIFPEDAYPVQYRYQDKIYNFILDSNHTINVNGNWCCTLGHDYKGDVIQHDFWGNSGVITRFLKANSSSYPYVVFGD